MKTQPTSSNRPTLLRAWLLLLFLPAVLVLSAATTPANAAVDRTITTTVIGSGTVDPAGTYVVPNFSSLTITSTPDPGNHLVRVVINGTDFGPRTPLTWVPVTSNLDVTVTFAPNTEFVDITSAANVGGTISPAGTTSVPFGTNQTYTITPDPGYLVLSVLVDGVNKGKISSYTFTNVTDPHTITANFVTDHLNIIATSSPGGTVTPAGTTSLPVGWSQSYTIQADPGFIISQIYIDGLPTGETYERMFYTNLTWVLTVQDKDRSISAAFMPNSSQIISSASAGGTISPLGTTTVFRGFDQTYAIAPNANYNIVDVLVDGVSVGATTSYKFVNVTLPHTIHAIFSIGTVQIYSAASIGGTINPAGTTTIPYGQVQSYTITPDAGYHIGNVLIDNIPIGAVPSYTFVGVTAPHTITALFVINSYDIISAAGANGTITPLGTTSVAHGSNQSYAIAPDPGYQVADVLVDGISVGATTTYTFTNVAAPHTISATFSLIPVVTYDIVSSAGPNGSISPLGTTTVNAGGSQTYAITPNLGYHILDVLIDNTSVGATTSYTFANVAAPHTISASFAIDMFDIVSSAGLNGTISPLGTTSVAYGGSQTYAITANAGFQVADVAVDNVSIGTTTSYTFLNVTAPHTISATFIAAAPVCQTGADTDGDGKISFIEFLSYVASWKLGNVPFITFLQAVGFWKAGTGC